MEPRIEKFICDQLSRWPEAAARYRHLKKADRRTLQAGGLEVVVQLNPDRSISSKAALDDRSVRERPCFLCPENRPEEQFHIDFSGDDHYMGLVLPYLYPGLLGLIKQLATAEGLFVWPRQFVDQNE